jgi:hypothetical protein
MPVIPEELHHSMARLGVPFGPLLVSKPRESEVL